MTTATAHFFKDCTYLGPEYDPRTSKISPAPYCGCPTGGVSNYCPEHHALVYQKGTSLRKRGKDIKRANAVRDLISDFDSVIAQLEAEGFDLYSSPVTEELV